MPDPDHRLSRRTFVGGLAGLPLLLAACGGVEGESEDRAERRERTVDHPRVPIRELVFSNWPLYIHKPVLRDFERRTGGKVRYVEDINDNFEFFSKVRQQLQRGQSINRDLVVLTTYMAARWIRNGWVEPIDKGNVPNARNLQDNLKSIAYDRDRSYSLPWQSGAIGIGYNPKRTGRELRTIEDLFDPRLKGRVSFLSEPYDSAGLVMLMQGVDAEKANLDQIMNAIDRIERAQRDGHVRRFTGNDYTGDLAKGNLWAAMAYSGDLTQLQPDNPDLEFVFPEEGAVIFTDDLLIPKRAEHPYAAEAMMNFVYEPQVAAEIAAEVNFITPVKGVQEVLAERDPELARNELIFPTDEQRRRLHNYPTLSPADEQAMRERMSEVVGG